MNKRFTLLILVILFSSLTKAEYGDSALFTLFPNLSKKLAYSFFGNLPTPIEKLTKAEKYWALKDLYIKRDDLTAQESNLDFKLFGGNKVRKLRFLLSDAQARGAKTVLTFGAVGSNHVVATGACAKALGLNCIAILVPQPNSHVVRRNLLLMNYYGVDMHFSIDRPTRNSKDFPNLLVKLNQDGVFPYFIPIGGSCALGAVGYVEAAIELKNQIDNGLCKAPEYIYVPAGSMGTVAGLIVGFKAVALKTKVIACATEPELTHGEFKKTILDLANQTNLLLNKKDNSFNLFKFDETDVEVCFDATGDEYGLFTKESINDANKLYELENIKLEGTYTAKAFGALLNHVKRNNLQDKVILFWNTFCSDDFSDIISKLNYKDLPLEFHQYFKDSVQPLDK